MNESRGSVTISSLLTHYSLISEKHVRLATAGSEDRREIEEIVGFVAHHKFF